MLYKSEGVNLKIPEWCSNRVPNSLSGSGVEGVVFARRCVCVRNRPREDCIAVPVASSAQAVTFGSFSRRVASFSVAGVALRDIPNFF